MSCARKAPEKLTILRVHTVFIKPMSNALPAYDQHMTRVFFLPMFYSQIQDGRRCFSLMKTMLVYHLDNNV